MTAVRHHGRLRRSAALALLAAAGAACGGQLTGQPGDAGPDCELSFTVLPERPEPGEPVQVTAYVVTEAIGFRVYEWSVEFAGEAVPYDVTSTGQDAIVFTPERSGVYEIQLGGRIGDTACDGSARSLNVLEEGARAQEFVLRIVPAPDSSGPPAQDSPLQIFGGAADHEYHLGTVTMDPGIEVSGAVLDASGAPIAAYLRASPFPADPDAGAPLLRESFARADGLYRMLLRDQPHDLLVVPSAPALAPLHVPAARLEDIPALTRLGPASPVAVAVVDGGGDPVAGARVSLVVAGVPSSVALTDESGSAHLEVRAAGPVAVSIVPPEPSGLPQIALAASSAAPLADGGGAVVVRYAALPAARTVSPVVHRSDGATPAPGSRVTWIARPIAAAASVSIDGGDVHPATGSARRAATAQEGGSLPPVSLPAAVYDAVVEPPPDADPASEAAAVRQVDLTSGNPAPAALDLAAPAELRGRITAPSEDGLELVAAAGVRVQAVARGLLVGATRAGASARTGADGRFALRVVGGAEYEITVDGNPVGQGRARWIATAPDAGAAEELPPAALPRILRVTGELVLGTGLGPAGGAHLQLLCSDCGPGGGAFAVAETLTDPIGRFALIAPDPGVDAPE